jgi:hypothetical protein
MEMAHRKPISDHLDTCERPHKHRSRATNDLYKIAGVHEQSQAGRRYGDLVRSFVAALGGEAGLNEYQRMAVRRAGELTVAAEMERAKMLRGEPVDCEHLVKIDNNAARAVRALGIKPRATAPTVPLRDRVGRPAGGSA